MSLIFCPECGNEVSNTAVACPNCGRPISSIPVLKETVIRTPVREESDIPKWIFIPLGILGVVVVFLAFMFFARDSDDSNMNVRVAANGQRIATPSDRTVSTIPGSSTTTIPVAPPVSDSQTVTVPGTGGTAPAETRGRVIVDAKVTASNGQTRPVRNEKFYLLDKDLETILSEADLTPIEGQSLSNSFGLSVTFPDRYGDFNRQALTRSVRTSSIRQRPTVRAKPLLVTSSQTITTFSASRAVNAALVFGARLCPSVREKTSCSLPHSG